MRKRACCFFRRLMGVKPSSLTFQIKKPNPSDKRLQLWKQNDCGWIPLPSTANPQPPIICDCGEICQLNIYIFRLPWYINSCNVWHLLRCESVGKMQPGDALLSSVMEDIWWRDARHEKLAHCQHPSVCFCTKMVERLRKQSFSLKRITNSWKEITDSCGLEMHLRDGALYSQGWGITANSELSSHLVLPFIMN